MLYICIEGMFGLISVWRTLERSVCRLATMILARSAGKVGDHLKKRGLTLYYSCRKIGHLAKECLGRRPSCLCCKAMDHEVLDFPRMIAKLEEMNMRQENPKVDPETKIMKESENVLLQMKETLNNHRHVRLS
jgi:hypothetical protein